jgi:transposase-like protein
VIESPSVTSAPRATALPLTRSTEYPKELMDRGIRLALEGERPIAHIAQDLGIHPEALLERVRRVEIDAGRREG